MIGSIWEGLLHTCQILQDRRMAMQDEQSQFLARFPLYTPLRITVEGMAYLLIGMGDGNGREAAPSVALFTDHERCLVFGQSCLFPACAVMEDAQSLANFLEKQMEQGAGTVVLDPQSRAEAQGGFPIHHAIELLRRLSDPPEGACEE
jgi:hypothetical protein